MAGQIFLVNLDGSLVEMSEEGYAEEARLQELLARHPQLLAGEQIDQEDPRRWVLVRREMGVPDDPAASNRWAVDHLFLDQDGVPTLVEVKRAVDTRARREVVAQMLDYAANATVSWPVEAIQTAFFQTCEDGAGDPDEVLSELLGPVHDPADFWQQVKTNLTAGRVRLVFVADSIAPELRRIVEFLNAQMNPAEVFALEIKQFSGSGRKTLVPRVVGQSAVADKRKRPGGRSNVTPSTLDEDAFFRDLGEQASPSAVEVAKRILDWARSKELRIWAGRGSFAPILDVGGHGHYLFFVRTNGLLEIPFYYMQDPFTGERRRKLMDDLNSIPAVSIPAERLNGKPKIELQLLSQGEGVDQLLRIADEFNHDAESHAGSSQTRQL